MQYPEVTALYAALLALLFVALSGWIIVGRGQFRVSLGDGGNDRFGRRIRSHGNFAEYVPLILILVSFLEMTHSSRFVIHALLLPLLIARLLHPVGMLSPDGSPQQVALRGGGMVITLGVLAISAIILLVRSV